jgi:hypothetical protein
MAGPPACSIVTREEWTDNFSRSNRDGAKYEVGLYEQDRLADWRRSPVDWRAARGNLLRRQNNEIA